MQAFWNKVYIRCDALLEGYRVALTLPFIIFEIFAVFPRFGKQNVPATPIVTLLVTTRVTGNEEARIERMITNQQLVEVRVVCSKAVPQSIVTCGIPIVNSGRYVLVGLPLKVNLASSLVINKDNFCELNDKKN